MTTLKKKLTTELQRVINRVCLTCLPQTDAFNVEGLLGITLQNGQIFLVNIGYKYSQAAAKSISSRPGRKRTITAAPRPAKYAAKLVQKSPESGPTPITIEPRIDLSDDTDDRSVFPANQRSNGTENSTSVHSGSRPQRPSTLPIEDGTLVMVKTEEQYVGDVTSALCRVPCGPTGEPPDQSQTNQNNTTAQPTTTATSAATTTTTQSSQESVAADTEVCPVHGPQPQEDITQPAKPSAAGPEKPQETTTTTTTTTRTGRPRRIRKPRRRLYYNEDTCSPTEHEPGIPITGVSRRKSFHRVGGAGAHKDRNHETFWCDYNAIYMACKHASENPSWTIPQIVWEVQNTDNMGKHIPMTRFQNYMSRFVYNSMDSRLYLRQADPNMSGRVCVTEDELISLIKDSHETDHIPYKAIYESLRTIYYPCNVKKFHDIFVSHVMPECVRCLSRVRSSSHIQIVTE